MFKQAIFTLTIIGCSTSLHALISSDERAIEEPAPRITIEPEWLAKTHPEYNDALSEPQSKEEHDTAVGHGSYADSSNGGLKSTPATAMGTGAVAIGDGSLAIGSKASSVGGNAGISVGENAKQWNGGIAIGGSADAGKGTSIIPGEDRKVNNNIAIGDSSKIHDGVRDSIALGSHSVVKAQNTGKSRFLHDNSQDDKIIGEVSFGGGNTPNGDSGALRRLTNVAGGSADTDAVNVSQLNAVNNDVIKNKARIDQLDSRINSLSRDIRAIGAITAAMTSLPSAALPGESAVAIAAGAYGSQNALALGASHVSNNGKIVMKFNAAYNSVGNFAVGAGAAYRW